MIIIFVLGYLDFLEIIIMKIRSKFIKNSGIKFYLNRKGVLIE